MKKFLALLPLVALLSGCALLPKKVEFFQRKVRAFPELSESAKETQRKAADYVATKAQETELEAVATKADTNVIASASETAQVASALSGSMGPPSSPWNDTSAKLAGKLDKQHADYNSDLKSYAKHIDKDAGKKIEGTGFFSVGYFTMWGIGLGVLALLFAALKIYGMVNPAVGAGTAVAERVGGAVLARGFHEVVQGGEAFKSYLEKSELTAEVKSKVMDLFRRGHMESQSKDVQLLAARQSLPR